MVYPRVANVSSAQQYSAQTRYVCTVCGNPVTNTFIPSQPDSELHRCDQRACLAESDRTRCAEAQREEGRPKTVLGRGSFAAGAQRLRKLVFVASIHGMCHIAAIGVALSKVKPSVPLHNELGLFFTLLLPVNGHATARHEPIVEKGLKERLDLLTVTLANKPRAS